MDPVKRPDFFIIGAAKAGTTSLVGYITQHDRVFVPALKEPNMFSDDPQRQSVAGMSEYLDLYRNCEDDVIAGDASTGYLYSHNAASRIHDFRPDAKIIMLLRNPVSRAYSLYWYNRRDFRENLSFEDAIAAEESRIAEGWVTRYHYLRSGLYCQQVKRYTELFPSNQILIRTFEEFVGDPDQVCSDIFAFFGVPGVSIDTHFVSNRSGVHSNELLARLILLELPGRNILRRIWPSFARSEVYTKIRATQQRLLRKGLEKPPPMSESTHQKLSDYYRDDIASLSKLIDRDLTSWSNEGDRSRV